MARKKKKLTIMPLFLCVTADFENTQRFMVQHMVLFVLCILFIHIIIIIIINIAIVIYVMIYDYYLMQYLYIFIVWVCIFHTMYNCPNMHKFK